MAVVNSIWLEILLPRCANLMALVKLGASAKLEFIVKYNAARSTPNYVLVHDECLIW